MGYRDDFYAIGNIIGYSGTLIDFPTVYFQTATEFGHITQRHGYVQNVGRNAVENAAHYTIGNELVNGVPKLVEKKHGQVFHESRSTLKRIDPNNFETVDFRVLGILTQAIRDNPNEKNISSFSRSDQIGIQRAESNMAAVLREMKST